MKSSYSVLAAAMLLPAAVSAQPAFLKSSPATPPVETRLSLFSDCSLPTTLAALVCAPVPPGAVAWWRAESNTVDTVGVNDLLFTQPSPRGSSYMPGKVGAAFRLPSSQFLFSATNEVFAPACADLDVGAGAGLTLEGWVLPDSFLGVQSLPLLEWNDGAGNIGAGLALNGSGLEAYLTDTNAAPVRRVVLRSAPGFISTSVWRHVALVFDKAAGLATLYTNGAAAAQTNLGALHPATRSALYLGPRPSGLKWGGGFDEWSVYNRALVAAELQSIVAADSAGKCVPPPPLPVTPPEGLVGWWCGESNAVDSVDANNGIVVGSVAYADGEVGKAFQSRGGYVRIPAASNLNLGLGPGLTLEAWISPALSGL